jgi:hypothetical protein
MSWIFVSTVACALAIGLLTTAILQHAGTRPAIFYSLSLVSSVFAGALAGGEYGFSVSEFYIYGLFVPELYVPSLTYPDTILLLLLYIIFIALGGYFHGRKRRGVRRSSD